MTRPVDRAAARTIVRSTDRLFRRIVTVVCAVFLILGLFDIRMARAQSLNLTSGDGSPVQIYADDGIEWQQENQVFYARGNARAVRGDVTVNADVLKAYYHPTNGTSQIWRLDAQGSVTISSPSEKLTGDLAIYDVPKKVLVMRGKKIVFTAGPDTITAKKQIEYWEDKQLAVARGDARAVRGDKRLNADVLAAYFKRQANGKSDVDRVEAFNNVVIRTPTETVTSDRGVYKVQTGLATLTGNVRLNRGSDVITGCRANVNMNTGISKMYACKNGSGSRVNGSIMPKKSEP